MAVKPTYDDFLKAMQSEGMTEDNFSSYDLELARKNPGAGLGVLYAKRDWRNAGTDEARALAHRAAEDARITGGGYSGGADGSGYSYVQTPGAFERAETPDYTSRNDALIRSQMGRVTGRAPFAWDAGSDPVWQQLQQQYRREGERAMKDTMAQASARTGGLASSYAGTAAAQANNYYMQQLADRLPEVYREAYDRYLQEYQQERDKLDVLRTAEQDDWAKYLDLLTQHNREQDTAYGQWTDEISDRRARQQYADDMARQDREYADALERQERAEQLQRAQLGAELGDYSGVRALGITPNTDNLLRMALANAGRTAPVGSGTAQSYEQTESALTPTEQAALEFLESRYGGERTISQQDWKSLTDSGVSEAFLRQRLYRPYSDAETGFFLNGDRSDATLDALLGEGYLEGQLRGEDTEEYFARRDRAAEYGTRYEEIGDYLAKHPELSYEDAVGYLGGFTGKELTEEGMKALEPKLEAIRKDAQMANYGAVKEWLEQAKAGGATRDELVGMLWDAYQSGTLGREDYERLYNQYIEAEAREPIWTKFRGNELG